jgi:lipoprotein-anchoring transpeptidase ErfK/SrfK
MSAAASTSRRLEVSHREQRKPLRQNAASRKQPREQVPVRTPASPAPQQIIAAPEFALQVALDRAGFSPGQIDGRPGALTKRALAAFQQQHGLRSTGEPDAESWAALGVTPGTADQIVKEYTITEADAEGPYTPSIPDDMMQKATLDRLGYTSVVEALSERFHVSPDLLEALNPNAAFSAGDTLTVPAVGAPRSAAPEKPVGTSGGDPAVTIVVSKVAETLIVRDPTGRMLMFAPVTVGSEHDPLPLGDWKVTGVFRNPTFNYNPELFWDADPAHSKAKLKPGPNNPAGVVWIALDRQHYGIHGTPEPGRIGYRQSHGCVRLTNWDAEKLASLVRVGTPVSFQQ